MAGLPDYEDTRLKTSSRVRIGAMKSQALADFFAEWTEAELPDNEDTRLKTLSHVRIGLSLAWKASLAIRYVDLLPL